MDEQGDPRQAEPHRRLHHHRRDSHHRPQPRHNLFQFPSRRGGAVPGRHTVFRGPRRLAGRVGDGGAGTRTAPRASDGTVYKYVTIAGHDSPRLVQIGVPIESSAGNLLYSVYQQQADILVRSRNLQALWIVNLEGELAAAARRAEMQTGDETVDTAEIFERRGDRIMADVMAQERVVSTASLSLFSPDDCGIWVASPIVNTGGILIGGLAIAVSQDDIALTVRSQAQKTALIAFVLLGLTAVAALWGTRLLTNPIEIIADAARQVETGEQPDPGAMQPVMGRSDEIGSLARVFLNMTVQVFSREEQLETLVSERTQELQTSNQHLRIAQEAIDQDLEMAKIVQAALVREGNVEIGPFSAYARMTPAQRFLNIQAAVYNTFYLQRHLCNRLTFKRFRKDAFNVWESASAAA